MTNGYIVLTKGEPNLYKHAVEAITLGKPIYYADGNKVAFVNSIELDSTNVVIKTSDKQITVEADGIVTENSINLKVLVFDINNLTLDGAEASNESYYSILTSLDVTKLSELPKGKYPVLQGTVSVSNVKVNIIYIIHREDDTLVMLTADDNEAEITITEDDDAIVFNI